MSEQKPAGPPWDLRLGDCLDPVAGLASLPNKSVDVTDTDPPYSEQVHSQGRRIRSGTFQDEANGQRQILVKPISYPPLQAEERREVAAQIARVTRRWIIVWCQAEDAEHWRADLEAGGARYVRTGIWWIEDAQPQYSGDRPGVGWLPFVVAYGSPGRMHWNGGGHCARHKGPSRERTGDLSQVKLVDGQKPLWLLEEQVQLYSDPGELILDPYMGSGTAPAAAVRYGRRALGWERDPGRHEITRRRLAGEEMRPTPGQLALIA